MINFSRHKAAMFFAILFMIIVTAPALIMSMNENADVAFFYGENEEEEKENFKLVFEIETVNYENDTLIKSNNKSHGYTFKNYPKPHLNLIFPPPDVI